MPQLVDVPSIGTVEFPDGISDEEMSSSIKKTLAKQNPPKITVGPVGPVTVLDKPIPAPLRQPLVSTPSFVDEMASVGSAVMKPISEAGATVFNTLSKATEGGVAPDLRPQTKVAKAGENLVNLPQVYEEDMKLLPKWLQVVGGVANSINKGISSLTEPGNALISPVAGMEGVSKPLVTAFLANTVASEPEAIQRAWKTYLDPNASTGEKSQAIADAAVVNPTFAGLLAHGIVSEAPKSLTPLTDQAVKQTVESKGGSDAIHQEASPVLPDVRTQPVSGEGQVPVAASGAEAGARSAPTGNAEEKVTDIQNVRPAIKTMDGNIVVGAKGEVHDDIIAKNGLTTKDIDSRLFVDANGNEISREQLAQMGVKSDKPVEGAHASDLADAQKAQQSQSVAETKPAAGVAANLTTPPSTAPELVGMGGATPSEFAPGDTAGRETYGIRQSTREARAAAGEGPEVLPGEGISWKESVERGRELLKQGVDPEKSMADFESNKRLSSDDMALARAQGEKLFQNARQVERKFGTDSPEYAAARKTADAWEVRSKAMQTESHRVFMAQQGATDIDTGSFTGLSREYQKNTGKEFTPQQAGMANVIADKVSSGESEADAAREALSKNIAEKAGQVPQQPIHPSILEAAKRIVAGLDKRADAARIRIREKLARASAGVDPTLILDAAEVGAAHLAHQIVDLAEWSSKVLADVGDWAKPHLEEIRKKSEELLEGIKNAPETQKVVRERKQSGTKVVSDAIKSIYGKEADVSKGVAEELKETPADSERQRVVDAAEKQLDDERNALEVAKVQEQAAKDAQAAANKTIREAAAERAKEETKQRVADAKRAKETAAIQDKAARDAQRAIWKTTREAAIKKAKDESAKRVEDAKRDRDTARVQELAAKKARQAAQKRVRDAAAASAKAAREALAHPEIPVWNKVKEYLDQGETSFDDMRNKVASDLGMSVRKVTDIMTRDSNTKRLADDAWLKQQNLRRMKETAKRWLREQALPGWQNQLNRVPRTLFAAKVGFHGTVALGTHAPMVLFQPPFWKVYFDNFGKMYKMVGGPTPKGQARAMAYYEMQVQDLIRNKNYTIARGAGLQNDPHSYEDFNSPEMSEYIGNITGMGNRGYGVLKLLRQDMFDQRWNALPKTLQIQEMAESIAKGVNHDTGVTQRSFGGVSTALFAPRLEASRVAWLVVDPLVSAKTFLNWKNATDAQKNFAVHQVKSKAWVFGTMATLLAVNQGILSATGSDQKINITDPMRSDFLKFKVAGMNASYGSAMVSMARLPFRLFVGIKNDGKMSKIKFEDENTYSIAGQYIRSQASPFAGDLSDLAFGRDFEERPLPRAGFGLLPGKTDIPKRLRAKGITTPYTWPEYISQAAPPIPFVEPIREVWKVGLGMSDEQVKTYMKAFAVSAFDVGTGGRLAEDTEPRK